MFVGPAGKPYLHGGEIFERLVKGEKEAPRGPIEQGKKLLLLHMASQAFRKERRP